MNKQAVLPVLLSLGVAIAGCGGGSGPCDGVSGKCVPFAANATEAEIQAAFATATGTTTFAFSAATYSFVNELSVIQTGVTIKGAGMDKTILDFSTQTSGGEGILAMNAGPFSIHDLTVRNSKGNAIKGLGVTGFTASKVHVTWTTTPSSTHGAYGIYPVQSTNVLLENNLVEGATDSGVYVGQSSQILVRNNTVQQNVAGIEIENSHSAEVYGNTAMDNTAGILVFALPELQVPDCRDVLVHDNMMLHNNTANFAAQGDIVAIVPAGTGSFIMASKNVEFRNNTLSDNDTANFAVISYLDSGMAIPPTDTAYYPYAQLINVHDNTFSGGGTNPDLSAQFSQALFVSQKYFPGKKDPDIIYDGTVDTTVTATIAGNPMNICLGGANNMATNAGTTAQATFTDLDFPTLDMQNPAAGFVNATSVETPFDCALPAVPAVTFPGIN